MIDSVIYLLYECSEFMMSNTHAHFGSYFASKLKYHNKKQTKLVEKF